MVEVGDPEAVAPLAFARGTHSMEPQVGKHRGGFTQNTGLVLKLPRAYHAVGNSSTSGW